MFSRLRALHTILATGKSEELFAELEGIIIENGGEEGMEGLVQACRSGDLLSARECIESLLLVHRPPVLKGDVDLGGYRTAFRLLETRISVLNQKKQDVLRRINAFRLRHNQEVGSIMARLLFLRKEILFLKMKDEPRHEAELKEAEKEYHTWERESSRHINHPGSSLNKKQQKELSALYRQISKRCHPDLVSEEQRQDAERMFHMLNRAYVSADLEEMRRLLSLLEAGELSFARRDAEVTELSRLSVRVQRLEHEVESLLREIAGIEESAIWQLISTLEDEDDYFSQLRKTLERELASQEVEYDRRRTTSV